MAKNTGNPNAEIIIGTDYNDILSGAAGSDTIIGGGGSDQISGDFGFILPAYVPSDGESNILSGGAGNDVIRGGLGSDLIMGDAGNDTLYGGLDSSISNLIRGGYSVNWSLDQGDLLIGGAGNDLLDGAGGNDTLIGGQGNDTLLGSAGVDFLIGGEGRDVFKFARSFGVYGEPESGFGSENRDLIADFQDGRDLIDLSILDFGIGFPSIPELGATFLGTKNFVASFALQARVTYEAGNTIVQLVSAYHSFNSSDIPQIPQAPEAEIELIGVHRLHSADFILF